MCIASATRPGLNPGSETSRSTKQMNTITATTTAPAKISTTNQQFPAFTVSIMVSKKGQRFAQIEPTGGRPYHVPTEMLGLAAGKDAWMRAILVKCTVCRTPAKAGDMECEMCPDCYDAAGEENARLDAGE